MSRHLSSALWVLVLGATWVAVRAADPVPVKVTPKKAGDVKGLDADPALVQGEAASKQEALRRQFDDFKQSLLRLAQRLEASSKAEDREKAATLKKAIALASEQGVDTKFTTLVNALKTADTFKNLEQLQVVMDKNDDLRKDLRNLIELLLTDNEDAERRRKRDEYARLLEKLKEIIAVQERIRDQTGLGRKSAPDLKKDQDKITKQTQDLVSRRDGKEGKGDAERKGDDKSGKGIGEAKDDAKDPKGDPRAKDNKADNKDGKPGDNKDGKPSDGKEGKGPDKQGKGDSKEGKGDPKDGKPSEGKEGKPSDGKEGKPSDGKGDNKEKAGDSKSGKPADGKASDPKAGNPSDAKGGDRKESKPTDGKGSDSKSKSEGKSDAKSGSDSKSPQGNDSKPSDSKGGQQGGQKSQQGQAKGDQQPPGSQPPPPPNDQSPPEQAQVKKQIQDANQDQHKAGDELAKNNRGKAGDNQDEAIRKLMEAKKKLEELLKQLREEEIERLLAALQQRCERMLAMQIAVRDATVALDKAIVGNSDKKPTRADEQQSNVLSDKEEEIVREASKALEIVKAEGSAVAFAEVFYQVRGDMTTVAGRLRKTDVGVVTVTIEKDIIATLEEMIEALKKARQDNQKPKSPMPGQAGGGQPPDPKLIDMLAELKMIRSMQKRVNDRTEVYGKQYEGEQAPAQNEMIQRELRELGNRQDKIGRIASDIYKGKNKAN